MDEFFSASSTSDPIYLAVRNEERYAHVRSHLKALWKKYSAYADPHFCTEIARQFQQRYWEMRLGCTLLDLGFILKQAKRQGPDYDACTSAGKHIYIEAVAVSSGQGNDAVPRPNFDPQTCARYPIDQIILRILGAIANKSQQHASYVKKEIIDPTVPYVIAINIGGIPGVFIEGDPPILAQSCLGIGSRVIIVDPDGPSEERLDRRDAISKVSKGEVDTRIFLHSEYSWLSGVLLSDVSAFIRYPLGAGGFQFLHNPRASQPIDHGWFPIGSEHWVEGDDLHHYRWLENDRQG